MKRKFLLVCTLVFALTTGMLQANSNPTMSRVYGNQFTPQVPDTQSAATIGTLDTTFSSGGYQELNTQLSPSAAVSIQALSDGTFLTVLQGSSVKVAKYNAEGTIQTYGTAGVATLGLTGVQASMLDVQGRLVVAGTAASGAPIQRVSADGTSVSAQFTGGTWTAVSALAQQTSGQIIAVGFNGTNAQIARYTLAGTLDTSFGTAGVVAFTASAVATTGLYNVVVDATNNIYVAYIDFANSNNLYVAKFSVNGAFVSTTHLSYFDTGATANQVRMAMDLHGNLIVAAQVGNNILVSAQILTIGSFTNTTITPVLTTLNLGALITTSNGEILLVGNDTNGSAVYTQRITCLPSIGGGLNTSFNPSLGYKEFSAITPTTSGSLYAAAIAVDGQIYAVGSESSGTLQPYVYRLNNYQYVSQVAQFPATTLEQGILDQTFGNPAKQTFSGVTSLYNGLYGSSMMQMANAAVEVTAGSVTHGDIVVGMNGYTNASGQSSMMLGWLTAEGSVDTSTAGGTIPLSGYLTLTNYTSSNETLGAMLEDGAGALYIAGTSDAASTAGGAFVRAYGSFTSDTCTYHPAPVGGNGAQGVGISLQGITAPSTDYRALLCVANTSTTGSIYGYNNSGVVDTTFGDAGSGHINTGSFGLHMGPSYGLVVSTGAEEAFIYAAYLDTTSLGVCVAKFQENGSDLIPEFGTAGVKQNIFTDNTVAANNIRIGLLHNNNLVVAAVTTTGILVAFLDPVTGATISGGSTPIAITGAASPGLNLTRVTGVSDGTVMLTFWGATSTDKTMYVARVTSGAVLDTTFNSQGSQPGVLPIQIGDKVTDYVARSATSAIIQSTTGIYQGNIAVVGYESVTANDATPMAMRVYGTPATTEVIDFPITLTEPGTFDTAYDITTLDSLGHGFGKVIFNYPLGTYMLVGIDTGTNTIVARVTQAMVLDTLGFNAGGTPGYVTLSGVTGVNHISIDKQNNILVGGSSGGTVGWAYAINSAGTGTPTPFTMPTSPQTIAAVNNIGQQESGRYIVAGKETTTGKGMLIAFQNEFTSASPSAFAVDPTFNPLGIGSATPGSFYVVSTDGLYAMAINTAYNAAGPGQTLCNIDTIVVAYSDSVSHLAQIAEVTADGSGFVIAAFATGVAADNSSVVQLNIDGSQNIVVGASRNVSTTSQVQVQRFDSAGGTTTHFTANGLSTPYVQTLPFTNSSGVVLTGLMETATQQTVLTGWTAANGAGSYGNGRLFAARLVADGALDTIWNTSPVSPDYAGLLTYNSTGTSTVGAINVTGSAIASPGGNIYSIGSTNATATSSDAIVTVVYGDNLITQISQNPLEAAAGTLDNTIPGNTNGLGALPLSPSVTGVPQKIYMYSPTVANGQMLIASKVDSTATVYVTLLNADLSLGTFGTLGVKSFTPNSGLMPTSVTITDLYVATNNSGYIYVTGYTTTGTTNTTFVERISANGSTATAATPVSSLTATTTPSAGGIHQSSNGRVLVSGYNGSHGSVVAYNSAMNAIDTSFGNNNGSSPLYGAGYYTTTIANPIVAMTTDSSDRIYIAYQASTGVINIDRLLENGTKKDVAFNSTGTVTLTGTALSTTQIKLAIDLTNNQLIVAAQDITGTTSIIQLKRFNISDGATAGSISTITLGGTSVLSLSDLFIDNNTTLYGLYPNIYVVGYLSSGTGTGNSVVARVKSTSSSVIALDTAYATTGIANIQIGSGSTMTVVTAAALDPDRRVYMVGSNGSTSGYMGRFFGDYYWTQASPAILQGTVGALDLTLNPNGSANQGAVDLSATAVTSATWHSTLALFYKARAIIENPNGDGSSYIAFSNGARLIVGKLNADMSPALFGSGGLTATQAMVTVNNMTIDAAGNIVVTGASVSAQVVYLYSSTGTLLATFSAPTVASTVGTTVAQQKSGRYIVGGYDGSANGLVSAYKNTSAISGSALGVDLTFGPAGNNGYYPTGVNAQVDDLVIDSNDYIYIVYRDGANTVNVAKLTPEGSLSTAINTPSTQLWQTSSTNPISTGITATQPARIAINAAGNILVGASTSAGVSTALYSGTAGTIIGSVVAQTLSNTPVLTKLVGSIALQNEFYGCLYDSLPEVAVFGITSGGALDFAPTYTDTQSLTQVTGLSVQFDGKVVAVGYNSSTDPVLVRFYGYPYMSQFAQAPDQVAAGQLDTTLWPNSGAFLLDATANNGFNTAISGMGITRIYEAGNGVMTFVATNGSNSIIFRLLKDLTLDPSFSATTLGHINANALYVNPTTGNIYMAGNSGSSTWASALSSSGAALLPNFNPTHSLATGNQIAQQSVGRVILAGQGSVAAGQANTDGYILGYTNTGALDITFGNGTGQLDMGTFAPTAITDIAIDSTVYYDNIIAVSNNSGTVVLQRVNAAGSVVTTLTGGTAITGAVGNPKVVFDSAGYIVVACATSSGYAVRSYNNDETATDNAVLATFTAGTTPILSNIYATSDEKITLIGYDSATTGGTAYDAIVARLVSASGLLTFDGTFNTALTGAGTPHVGVLIASLGGSGSMNQFFDGIIHADNRIMVVGSHASSAAPYMARVFGDTYVTYDSQAPVAGTAGTLNTGFGDAVPATGTYNITSLNALLNQSQGKAILPLANGGYYQAFDHANSAANSILIKTVADGSLDTSYNNLVTGHIAGIAGSATSPNYAPLGVNSILLDGSGKMLLVGTTPTSSHGWLQRYTSAGLIDNTANSGAHGAFNSTGVVNLASGTVATVAVEQTLARYVVAGSNGSGAVLFAYQSLSPNGTPGTADITFNAGVGGTPGYVQIGSTNTIWNLVADQYDRLIFAVLNSAGNAVDLYRLTPTGEPDVTFGTNGKVANALTSAAGAASVRVALDVAGNIIVTANSSTLNTFSVRAFDNLVSSLTGANGAAIYAQLNISSLTGPSVTAITTSADGYALILGTQTTTTTGDDPAWIARITAGGLLDTAGFNHLGSPAGIFQYTEGPSIYHIYDALAVNADGTLGMLGYESDGSSYVPTLVSVYDDPYTSQESQTPDSKAVGSIDPTLGVGVTSSAVTAVTDGIIYYAAAGNASSLQVAEAVALYDDNNIVVAIDAPALTGSNIMINMFDNDGLLNPNFGSSGTATVVSTYANQYVRDMVTFTAGGVTKAILAGYAYNSALPSANQYSSLVAQYNLVPGGTSQLDSSFGGFDENPSGIAFGDGQKAFVIGQQSTGRIVVGGLSQDNLGLLLGYTAAGKLDTSFANDGYQSGGAGHITGQTGIYSHAIDKQNRVVFAYDSGTVASPTGTVHVARMLADGSGLDTSFDASASFITGAISISNIKVALDSSNNVYVAVVKNDGTGATGNSIAMKIYSNVNGNQVTTNTLDATVLGGSTASDYTLGRLIVDAQGNGIIVASDSVAVKNLIVRVTSGALALDSTFNGTGYITYQVAGGLTSQVAKDAMVHPDGRIIIVGSEV